MRCSDIAQHGEISEIANHDNVERKVDRATTVFSQTDLLTISTSRLLKAGYIVPMND